MKFLVLGASGMAGHMISIYLKEHNHIVDGFSRRYITFVNSITGDVSNTKLLQRVIENGEYDIVINAIGILNQFAEDNKDTAVFVNSYLPHFLATVTNCTKTRIFHMSTDCVFSGHSGPYTEFSFKDGESFYDRTKALGELVDSKNLTFRNSIVGPDMNENGIGLFNWFMKQTNVKGYTNAMWTGLTTLELAKIMEYAAKSNVTGLINMVHESNISKYDLLKLFNHYMRDDKVEITPYDGFCLDKTLVRTNFELNYIVPRYEEMIQDLAQWIRNHKDLYPFYNI